MIHIMIPESIAVRTENGFTAPISAWEQNIAIETATALSRVLPRSRVHIFARRHCVPRVFVVLNPSNFRYSTTNWDMKVSFHTLPSSLRQLPNTTLNKLTTGCHFVYPIGIDKVLAETQRAKTHQGDPQTCIKICYESTRAGFRSSDRRQYSGSLLRGLGAISLIITGSPRLSSSGRRERPVRYGCKVKFLGRQRGGVGIKLQSFLTSALDGMSDKPHAPAP